MKIAGITIGPIGDTVSLAKSPAMLWYASSVFSRFAFVICRNVKEKIADSDILVPYVTDEALKSNIASYDGIGKYHDRIVFKAKVISDNMLCKIIEDSKSEIAGMISDDIGGSDDQKAKNRDYLMNYFQAHFVIVDDDSVDSNAILATSDYLDVLEQMRSFNPDNSNNPIIQLFGGGKDRNHTIKTCKMLEEVGKKNSQLMISEKKFRDIEDIAGVSKVSSNDKGYKYYAVIQADGDGMGKFLNTVKDDESIVKFSQSCISYAGDVSKIIGEYGGMTVYAGGDDLLAIVPVISSSANPEYNVKNVFDLCEEINKCFNNNVSKISSMLSLSIGTSIRYLHFPLYEALNAAAGALFSKSKSVEGKNCFTFDFQKHSGQSIMLTIPEEKLDYIKGIISKNTDVDTVNSIIYILDCFKSMFFEETPDLTTVLNIFDNLYDNAYQGKYKAYVNEMAEKLYALMSDKSYRKVFVFDDEKVTDLKTFEGVLRIKKFISEEVYYE